MRWRRVRPLARPSCALVEDGVDFDDISSAALIRGVAVGDPFHAVCASR